MYGQWTKVIIMVLPNPTMIASSNSNVETFETKNKLSEKTQGLLQYLAHEFTWPDK